MKNSIGYFPYSKDLNHPGDRRRIARWAKLTNRKLNLYPKALNDVTVFSEAATLKQIKSIKGFRVLDLIDPYYCPDNLRIDFIRSIGKKFLNRDLTGKLRYSESIIDICRNVDVVICSSPEQAERILEFNRNVLIILDFHSEISELPFRSRNSDSLSLLWEGQSATLPALIELRDYINVCCANYESVNLFVVSDEFIYRYANKFGKNETIKFLSQIGFSTRLKIFFYPWSIQNLTEASKSSDIAIIPVATSRPSQILKPENRLLIMWRLGLPALVSSIPSHLRIENATGLPITCNNTNEWFGKTQLLQSKSRIIEAYGKIAKGYLEESHSENVLISKWNSLLE